MKRFPTSALKVSVFTAVAVLFMGALATVIGNLSFQPARSFSALFTDATLVQDGNIVRLSGVQVGTVSGVHLIERDGATVAKVEFTVDESIPIYRDARIEIRYANLVGKRYLAIVEEPGRPATMSPGGTFGLAHTKPALNLTMLFNGFQPLFQALSPDEVNKLSYGIIHTLQGEGDTLGKLLANTTRLASTIANKDEVIGQVIDNLNKILTTVDTRESKLTELITQFRDLMTGLAEHRATIGESLPDIASLLNVTSGLVADARVPLRTDIAALGSLSSKLAATKKQLDTRLQELPHRFRVATRVGSHGSWFNFYLCGANLKLSLLGQAMTLRPPATVHENDRNTVCAKGVRHE